MVFRLVKGIVELITSALEERKQDKAAGYLRVASAFGLKMFERLQSGEDLDDLLNKRAKDLMTEEEESEVAADEAVKRAKKMFGQ
jgi:hypothetical protein